MLIKYTIIALIICWAAALACQSEQQLNYARYYINGKYLYQQNCQNCHQADGKGLGELIPPLTDSVFLSTNKQHLACMIKYGLKGSSIVIQGKTYQENMPSNVHLADIEIAELITYISNSFGNTMGLYGVEHIEKDLKQCKDSHTE